MESWTLYMGLSALTFVIFSIIFIYILIGSLRDDVVFRPTRNHLNKPSRPYKDVWVGDVMTRWFVQEGNDTVLFYLHGNSGNISDRSYVEEFAELTDVDLVLIDYRGYGLSRGHPSIANMREDASQVMSVILQEYDASNVIVMSESLGSIPAAYIAAHFPLRAVVILAGISSFHEISNEVEDKWMRFFSKMVFGKLNTEESNYSLLSKSKSPVLIVHSKTDEVVPYKCAQKNAENLQHRREIVVIEGGHSTPIISEGALQIILRFMNLPCNDTRPFLPWLSNMEKIGASMGFRIVED